MSSSMSTRRSSISTMLGRLPASSSSTAAPSSLLPLSYSHSTSSLRNSLHGSGIHHRQRHRSPSVSTSATIGRLSRSSNTAGQTLMPASYCRRPSLPAQQSALTSAAPSSVASSRRSSTAAATQASTAGYSGSSAVRRRARSGSVQRFTLPLSSGRLSQSSAGAGMLSTPHYPLAPLAAACGGGGRSWGRSVSPLSSVVAGGRSVSHSSLSLSSAHNKQSDSGGASGGAISSGYSSSSTLNSASSEDVRRSPPAADSGRASSLSSTATSVRTPSSPTKRVGGGVASTERVENGEVDYKKLYEEAMLDNDRLRRKLSGVEDEFRQAKLQADKYIQMANSRVAAAVCDSRESRCLERKLAEMEEELKSMNEVRSENRRLRDENGALIRVISKLSK